MSRSHRPRHTRFIAAIALVTALTATSSPAAASSNSSSPPAVAWSWPIAPPHRISHGFIAPATRYSAGHRGIDIEAGPGVGLVAPVAARVYFAGRVVDRPVITLETASGILISMEPVVASVPVGTVVRRAQAIGVTGAGGHCDGRCVHVGVRAGGRYVSPLFYLGGIERAVLLPLS